MRQSVVVATKSLSHLEIRKLLALRLPKILRGRLPYNLHPYQVDDLEAFIAWLKNKGAAKRGYYEWATGLGKTVEFCVIIAACQGLKVLVIESGKQLVSQTAKEVVKFTDESIAHASSVKKIETLDGDEIVRWKNGGEHSVLVTTDESFKLSPQKFVEFNPDVIIWDECHWGYTQKAQAALGLFTRALSIGFSATPDYLTTVAKSHFLPVTLENGQVLYADPDRMAQTHFGDRIAQRGLRWGIENKWLAPLAWGAIEFGFSLDEVPIVNTDAGFDYDEGVLHKVLAQHWPLVIKTVVKLYKSGQYDLANRHVAAICPGIAEAEELTKAIKKLGITAECITNKTKDDERTRILEAADRGEVKFLASVFALREGWDCKLFEIALMLRPTRSRVLYIQFMGRVLRLLQDKVALVVDPFFLNTRFAPLSAPVLFGLPGQEVKRGAILIGPKGKKLSSPYLIKLIERSTPKLIIEHPEIEYWADESGFFEADGERWGTIGAYAKLFKLSHPKIAQRLTSCSSREGRDRNGWVRNFYSFANVQQVCKDLLKKMPLIKNGFFKEDGETWAVVKTLAKLLSLSTPYISKRLDSCRKRKAKNGQGKICAVYALSDVRKACGKHVGLTQAGPDGTIREEEEIWAPINQLPNLVGISVSTLSNRLDLSQSRKGKDLRGRERDFYPLSYVKKVCTDLLKIPQAGPDGFFRADGERWGTTDAIADELNLSNTAVAIRLVECRKKEGRGKGKINKLFTFYALSDARVACADLLQDVPQAGPDGFFRADGERWGSIIALSRQIGISRATITSRLSCCRKRSGKTKIGLRFDFYALSDARVACADLLQDVPQAGPDGFFRADGERWGTMLAIANELELSTPSLLKSRKSFCRKRKGKLAGHVLEFYALSDMKRACVDIRTRKKSSTT